MSIEHKFLETAFNNSLSTENAILKSTSYKPEILILGTFNPNTPNANHADFFYGRNFFWPAFKNLFIHNELILLRRRMSPRGPAPVILNPSINEIFEICSNLKLSFADLISEVLHFGNPAYQILENDNIIHNNIEYNLIQDGQQNGVHGLHQLNNIQQVNWNTNNIIKFLCNNPQIQTIYFTRRPTGIWAEQWEAISSNINLRDRFFTNIFTPSAAGEPVYRSMARLLNHWIHNDSPNFGKLNNNWLIENGVNINNF